MKRIFYVIVCYVLCPIAMLGGPSVLISWAAGPDWKQSYWGDPCQSLNWGNSPQTKENGLCVSW